MSAYVVPPHFKPVSLLKTIEASSSSQKEQGLDLNWEPFQAHIEAFLRAVSFQVMLSSGSLRASHRGVSPLKRSKMEFRG